MAHPYPVNHHVLAVDELPENPRDYPAIRRMEQLLADLVTMRENPRAAPRVRSLWRVDLVEAGLTAPFAGRIVYIPRGLPEGVRLTDEMLEETLWEPWWIDEPLYPRPDKNLGELYSGRSPPDEGWLAERLRIWDERMAASPERQVARNRSARVVVETARRERWDYLVGTLDFPELALSTAATKAFKESHSTYHQLVKWLESRSRMLTLCGKTSTGKTTAAMALLWMDMGLKRYVEDGAALPGSIRYVRSADLLRLSAEKGRKDVERPEASIEKATVLIIDEVGGEAVWKDRVAGYYDGLIDRRYSSLRYWTILISNNDAGELVSLLGKRAMRRLTESPSQMHEATEFISPGQQPLHAGGGW